MKKILVGVAAVALLALAGCAKGEKGDAGQAGPKGEQGVAGADEPVGRVARRARGDVGDEEAAVGGVRDAQGHARHGGGRPAAPSHARCWGILAPSRVCTA